MAGVPVSAGAVRHGIVHGSVFRRGWQQRQLGGLLRPAPGDDHPLELLHMLRELLLCVFHGVFH